ncbi:hypothetical protein [uncultured Schumannella sp.]|uniref:hypothetical protein n=1 Tax=uncultured Schumannella sp. TaxID=1195956 RepID=UPI0025D3DA7A|nr:hypothetical protein [uncultured Schumannella sp.]
MLTSRRRAAALSAALIAALVLSGCAPEEPAPEPTETVIDAGPVATPTPTETRPIALEDLAIGPDGLADLVLGQPVDDDPELGLIHLDPAACTDEQTGFDAGIVVGDPLAALWIANDLYRDANDSAYFGVNVEPGGVITRIDLFTFLIPTTKGVRIGDPDSVVFAAYPDATVITGDLTDLVVVEGEFGKLQLEIARENGLFDTPYWKPGEADTVRYINASVGSGSFNVVASDNIAGVCPF